MQFQEEYLMYLRKSRNDGEKVPVEVIVNRHEKTLQDLSEKELGFRIPEKNIYREIVSGGEAIEDRPSKSFGYSFKNEYLPIVFNGT